MGSYARCITQPRRTLLRRTRCKRLPEQLGLPGISPAHDRQGRTDNGQQRLPPVRRAGEDEPGGLRLQREHAHHGSGRGQQNPAHRRDAGRGNGTRRARPQQLCGSPGRRRGGRCGRLYGRHLLSRHTLCAGTHHRDGPSGQLRGRQDGCEPALRQEPGGEFSPAATGAGRPHHPHEPAAARDARGDGRDGEARRPEPPRHAPRPAKRRR